MLARITADGIEGQHGSHERKASDGFGPGSHGNNGRDASSPQKGQDGGIIDVSASMEQNTGNILLVGSIQQANGGSKQDIGPKLKSVSTDFHLSAKGGAGGRGGIGGKGGNGMTGSKGRNATRWRSGENGGPGGDAGDAGAGSDGADGGTGGRIDIRLRDKDSYLLMAFSCSEKKEALDHAVQGGCKGLKGKHGLPGLPGEGGRGGHSHTWTTTSGFGENRTTHTHHNPGGHKGPSGRKGRKPAHLLKDGKAGKNGKLTIHVNGENGVQASYGYRYDLQLAGLSLQSHQRLQELSPVFQFTDQVQITDITCQNLGGMITPIQGSNVHFAKNYEYLVPNLDAMGWFQKRIEPEGVGPASGTLSFGIEPPNIRELGDDMDPLCVKEKLYLGATQLGAHGFERPHPSFDMNGALLEFRFPVENQTKLEGLPTICAGDGMHVKFCVTNTSLRDLGAKSDDKRKLLVQFYRNGRKEYDIASHHIDLQMDGVECNSKLEDNTGSVWRGTQIPIDFLKAGHTKTFNGALKLSPQVTPYSHIAIQAEILLQELDQSNSNQTTCSRPQMIPIQRRQLVVSAEPTYLPSPNNHVVIVSSAATKKEQFNAWSNLLTQRLGLNVEYYSVSIYGSLDPEFKPPKSNFTLSQAFAGKLVIVLDDTFNPLHDSVSKMEPSRMLPNGCQQQTSGYDSSTQWLLAGSSDAAIRQALVSHYTAPANDVTSYKSLSDFKKELKEELRAERKGGCVSNKLIREASIRIKHHQNHPRRMGKRMDKQVKVVKRFLEVEDPLRQYIVEPRCQVEEIDGKFYRQLIVRRGYCRTANTAHVLKRARPPTQNDRTSLLAVMGSLPTHTLHLVFMNAAAANNESLVEAALDVFTQNLLWEVSNVVDGKLHLHKAEDTLLPFPTLATAINSSELKKMAFNTGGKGDEALSRVVARFECVARSRDLNPWFLPRSLRHPVRKALQNMVVSLKKELAAAICDDARLKEIQAVEKEVLNHLRHTYGFPTTPRLRSASRWRKGLLYICSHRNNEKYTANSNHCGPTIRLCEMETQEYTTKSRAIAPSKTVASEHKCCLMRQQADDQKAMAAQLLKSIQETRDRQGLGNNGEIEVVLGGDVDC